MRSAARAERDAVFLHVAMLSAAVQTRDGFTKPGRHLA
jgi:hypothetical protein